MSLSFIMRPISQIHHVVSIIFGLSLHQRIKLINILMISLYVSKSISFFLRQEDTMIVLRHSLSKISCKFSCFSERSENHLQASCWNIFSLLLCMKNRSFERPLFLINSLWSSGPLNNI